MRKSAPLFCALLLSLSARRAWIEIVIKNNKEYRRVVALRKESVDRNIASVIPKVGAMRSLSARRAWIEIGKAHNNMPPYLVALRKESVDRNCASLCKLHVHFSSLSARRAWIEIPPCYTQ